MSEHQLYFREGTCDRNVWRDVAELNEYGLPDAFAPDDVILDIGAHIGSFTVACLARGAGCVVAVEPDPDNAYLWRHNVHMACGATDRAVLITAAAWRSDVLVPAVRYAAVGTNTGGGNTLGDSGLPVRAVPFDALVRLAAALSPARQVRLVKLDCEGAEWPCLFSTVLAWPLVEEVVGEYHEVPDLRLWPAAFVEPYEVGDRQALRTLLVLRGFTPQIDDTPGLGKFRAARGAPVHG